MADLIVANSTYAVGTPDSASPIVANVTVQDPQHINGPVSAILGVQTILGNGTTLKGSLADLATRLAVSLNADGTLTLDDFLYDTGDICPSMRSSKTGWLLMGAAERSNTTYEALLTVVLSRLTSSPADCLRYGTGVSVSANSGTDTFTASSHGLSNNQVLYFVTAGSLPGNVSAATKYYVVNAATNTFQISTTSGGSVLDISSNGSGTQFCTTFVCDARGTSFLGADNMDGSSRNRVTDPSADQIGGGAGDPSTVATHTHGVTDPGHTHASGNSIAPGNFFQKADTTGGAGTVPNATTGITIQNAGSGTGNMHPYTTVNYFIKT